MRTLLLFVLLPSVALAGARGSAFQKESKQGANFWAPSSAIDGKLETAWMVPGESANRGEWIEIDIPQGEVDKIRIFPGFAKSEETFADYPRVKQLRVDVYALDDDQKAAQVGSSTIDIADKREWQTIELPDAQVAAGLFGGRVRLSVVDIHEGEDYPNLAMSEVLVQMKEFDAKVKISAVNEAPTPTDELLDENPKTAWLAPGASFTLSLDSSGFGLSSIGLLPGGKDFARPKTVEITASGITRKTELADKPTEVGWAEVPGFNGYTGGAFGGVEVKVLDVWPGAKSQDVKIAEMKTKATNFESL